MVVAQQIGYGSYPRQVAQQQKSSIKKCWIILWSHLTIIRMMHGNIISLKMKLITRKWLSSKLQCKWAFSLLCPPPCLVFQIKYAGDISGTKGILAISSEATRFCVKAHWKIVSKTSNFSMAYWTTCYYFFYSSTVWLKLQKSWWTVSWPKEKKPQSSMQQKLGSLRTLLKFLEIYCLVHLMSKFFAWLIMNSVSCTKRIYSW